MMHLNNRAQNFKPIQLTLSKDAAESVDLIISRLLSGSADKLLELVIAALTLSLFGFPRVRLCRRPDSALPKARDYCPHELLYLHGNGNPRLMQGILEVYSDVQSLLTGSRQPELDNRIAVIHLMAL